MNHLSQTMSPKNGHALRVIRVARISTVNQDERSLDDQLALLQHQVGSLYDGSIEYHDLATQGSGEMLDREELIKLEELIESDNFDLVIAEDLARICRRTRAIDICELCEDHSTRLIAINDRVDTAEAEWRDGAFISSWHHEKSNRDTSLRIKRSLRNRFQQGAILTDLGPFYVIPEGATNVDQVKKQEGADEIVLGAFKMLEGGSSYAEVADWLNDVWQFPPGGSSRKEKWDGTLVRARFLNPRIKGVDVWNTKHTVRINKTGRRKQVTADPSETLTRRCPHLAFVDEDRFDRLVRTLDDRNADYRRSPSAAGDPLRGRAKKRTPFPGQMIYCGICGRKFVFGGHGRTEHLMCDGARQYKCWNGRTIDGPLAANNLATAVLEVYESLPEFDDVFLKLVHHEAGLADAGRQQRLQQLMKESENSERRVRNLVAFVEQGDISNRVREQLRLAEDKLRSLYDQIRQIEKVPSDLVSIPNVDDLLALAHQALSSDTFFSWDVNKVMQKLTPKIVVFPYRLIDGGHIVHRAWCQLNLGGLLPDARPREALNQVLQRPLCVDLFEPPQRELYREQVVVSRRDGRTEREIASMVGITITAVQRAASLQRELDARRLDDPYRLVCAPPRDYTKLRRHLHPRYQFMPRPDAGRII